MTARILVVDDIEANVRLLQAKLEAGLVDVRYRLISLGGGVVMWGNKA